MDKKFKILVIGDIILDEYVHVQSLRQAEEAAVPVWDEVRKEYRLGGAANVAANLASIGKDEVEVHLAGICGSLVVSYKLDEMKIKRERMMGHQVMKKVRYVQDERIVARADNFKSFDEGEVEFFEMMMNYWEQDFDAVVFSDYDKGTITPEVVSIFKKCAHLTVVDSKRADLRIFDGMTVLKVNEREAAIQVASPLYHNYTGFFEHVVVTKGDRGSTLVMCDHARSEPSKRIEGTFMGPAYVNHTEEFPIVRVTAKDVTGCGDTHTAAMTFSLLKNRDIRSAVKFANTCASQVVKKFGTSVADV